MLQIKLYRDKYTHYSIIMELPRWCSGKDYTYHCRRHKRLGVQSLGQEDSLEEEMTICSSILAWKIPWTEESGRLLSMGSQRVD